MFQEQEPVLGGLTRLSAPGAFHPAVLAQLFVNHGYRERWFGWRPHFKRTDAGIILVFAGAGSIELAIAPLGIMFTLKARTEDGRFRHERGVTLAIDSSPEETVSIMWEAVDGFLAHLGWPAPR
jgi:hypothetical protein